MVSVLWLYWHVHVFGLFVCLFLFSKSVGATAQRVWLIFVLVYWKCLLLLSPMIS